MPHPEGGEGRTQRVMMAVRSLLFYLGLVGATLILAVPLLAAWRLSFRVRDGISRLWCRFVLLWLRWTCGIWHRVEGMANLPDQPAILFSKHQSAWETLAFRLIFPVPMNWVIRSSLFRIPFFGWSLRALEEIGIDRSAGRGALRQIERKGAAYLAQRRWIVIFPEGSRIPVGESGHYSPGGAHLAKVAGAPVVPVAHNAGRVWPRKDWRKRPGTIIVRIGPPIDPQGLTVAQITHQARDWIEAQMETL